LLKRHCHCSFPPASLLQHTLNPQPQIRDFTEVERLAAAERLEDLLLVGNPLYNEHRDNNTIPEYRVEVRCRHLLGCCLCLVKGQGAGWFGSGCGQLAATQ
jgi:hypothetical protein